MIFQYLMFYLTVLFLSSLSIYSWKAILSSLSVNAYIIITFSGFLKKYFYLERMLNWLGR